MSDRYRHSARPVRTGDTPRSTALKAGMPQGCHPSRAGLPAPAGKPCRKATGTSAAGDSHTRAVKASRGWAIRAVPRSAEGPWPSVRGQPGGFVELRVRPRFGGAPPSSGLESRGSGPFRWGERALLTSGRCSGSGAVPTGALSQRRECRRTVRGSLRRLGVEATPSLPAPANSGNGRAAGASARSGGHSRGRSAAVGGCRDLGGVDRPVRDRRARR